MSLLDYQSKLTIDVMKWYFIIFVIQEGSSVSFENMDEVLGAIYKLT
jgi:hypothetical protein